jgi:hypothetical protein
MLGAFSMQDQLKQWVNEQWENTDLGDSRRNKRAIKIAQSIIRKPDLSLPNQLEHWAALKAAYRFFNTEEITHEALQRNHRKKLLEKAEKEETVLFIQDTSELDYTSHQATDGLGPIGSHTTKGLLFHSTLAVACKNNDKQILGLAHQIVWTRENTLSHRKQNETRSQRRQRPKESSLWKDSLNKIIKPKNVRWISVGDRGNDVFDFFTFCESNHWDYLIRVNQDRSVIVENEKQSYLKEFARKLPFGAQKSIYLRGRNNLQGRNVGLKISWGKVTILHPKNHGKKYANMHIEAWCVRCWEDVKDGIEWILLTNLPVNNAEEALEKTDWYSARWIIEEYHKCLKTGCAIEKRQLRTKDGLLAILGFLGVIATKLLALKFASRHDPHDLAKNHIPSIDLQILCSYFHLDIEAITLQTYWRKVASLGGFIGRKSDGDPGWQTLWKGLHRLFDMISGAELIKNCG